MGGGAAGDREECDGGLEGVGSLEEVSSIEGSIVCMYVCMWAMVLILVRCIAPQCVRSFVRSSVARYYYYIIISHD